MVRFEKLRMVGILFQSETGDNLNNTVKKPYRLVKEAFPLYYSASLHIEKPKRAIPKMVYAANFLVFLVPAMAMFNYERIAE